MATAENTAAFDFPMPSGHAAGPDAGLAYDRRDGRDGTLPRRP